MKKLARCPMPVRGPPCRDPARRAAAMRALCNNEQTPQEPAATHAGAPPPTGSSLFACPACGVRNCSFMQVQTRSADESMTVFAWCLACGKRWKES